MIKISAKFFIFFFISTKNFFHWSQESFERVPIQRYNAYLAFRDNIGSSWFIFNQCSFTKVVSWLIMFYNLCWFSWLNNFSGIALSLNYHRKLISIFVSLFNNAFSSSNHSSLKASAIFVFTNFSLHFKISAFSTLCHHHAIKQIVILFFGGFIFKKK